MMRQTFAALVLLALPALVAAQPASSTSSAPSALGPIGLPLPPIGLPLPSIGLPLPPIGLQSPRDEQQRKSGHPRGIPADDSRSRDKRFHARPTIVYFGSPYAWGHEPPAQTAIPGFIAPEVAPLSSQPVTGRLRLEIQPADALQLYVDSEYVGTPEDVGAELELEPGSRSIEIRAPGYETLVLDAKIVGLRTITYRGALKPIALEAPPDSAPRRETFYLIPGCYMGNVPPHEVKLPPDCDLSRLITRTP